MYPQSTFLACCYALRNETLISHICLRQRERQRGRHPWWTCLANANSSIFGYSPQRDMRLLLSFTPVDLTCRADCLLLLSLSFGAPASFPFSRALLLCLLDY